MAKQHVNSIVALRPVQTALVLRLALNSLGVPAAPTTMEIVHWHARQPATRLVLLTANPLRVTMVFPAVFSSIVLNGQLGKITYAAVNLIKENNFINMMKWIRDIASKNNYAFVYGTSSKTSTSVAKRWFSVVCIVHLSRPLFTQKYIERRDDYLIRSHSKQVNTSRRFNLLKSYFPKNLSIIQPHWPYVVRNWVIHQIWVIASTGS